MRLNIYCLTVQNGSLTDDVYHALARAAQKILREQGARCRVKGEQFEGAVTTRHRSACSGGLAGVVFDATVDEGRRTIRVRYLCPRILDAVPLDHIFLEPADGSGLDRETILEQLGLPGDES